MAFFSFEKNTVKLSATVVLKILKVVINY